MPAVERTESEKDRLSDLLRTAPAKTIEGIQAQLDYMFADFCDGGSGGFANDPECLALITIRKALKQVAA